MEKLSFLIPPTMEDNFYNLVNSQLKFSFVFWLSFSHQITLSQDPYLVSQASSLFCTTTGTWCIPLQVVVQLYYSYIYSYVMMLVIVYCFTTTLPTGFTVSQLQCQLVFTVSQLQCQLVLLFLNYYVNWFYLFTITMSTGFSVSQLQYQLVLPTIPVCIM